MNNAYLVSVSQKNKNMAPSELDSILKSNVVDLRFVRKVQVRNKPPTRRMLCTKNNELLTSNNGLLSLNYRAPVFAPKYNPAAEGLVIAWDIFMQDFRNIWAETVTIINTIPANDQFWEYFNNELRLLSPQEKMRFMAS